GIVLASTFSALAVLPILFLAQIAFIVAFGVLLDTFVVRSLVVPAAVYLLGDRVWWPSRLARSGQSSADVLPGRREPSTRPSSRSSSDRSRSSSSSR
ncbi:MAG TPA: MMPL family transporter, partial [Actinomycetes bacterium]|nr:MMPL family transporter [Actinomycetes bacterium]